MNEEAEVSEKDLEDASKLLESISNILVNSKLDASVCIYTLMRILILGGYKMKISKPHLLNMVSEEWELFDEYMEKMKDER